MSVETPKKKRSWGLRVVGLAALAAAVATAAFGILGRQDSDAKLARWTDAQAVPSVTTIMARHGEPAQEIVLPADVQAWSQAVLYARVGGYLKSWDKDIGALVKAGDVLGTIEAPELDQQLDQARAKLASAQADAELAQVTAKRWQALLTTQAVSRQAADEKASDADVKASLVNAADAEVRRLQALEGFKQLTAPFDGVVTARNTDIGDLISVGSGAQPLFTVSQIQAVRVYVRVPQDYSGKLRQGMMANLKLAQYPDEAFPAKLLTTSDAVAKTSRTVLAQLVAGNADGKLLPGAYAEVHFKLPADPDALTLPASALVFRQNGMEVATLGPGDKVVMKPITIKRDLGTTVEVSSGVSAADEIIDNPPDWLAAGTVVKASGAPATASAAQIAASAGAPH